MRTIKQFMSRHAEPLALTMLQLLALSVWGATMMAQTSTITLTGPATVRPGNTITLPLTTTAGGAAAYQWRVGYPGGLTVTTALGSSGIAASKSLTCSPDNTFCVLAGLNANVVAAGPLSTLTVMIPSNTAAGPIQFPLSNVVAATPTGTAATTILGPPYSVVVLIKQDLNGDGKVDVVDMQAMINQVITAQTTPAACTDDMNGDGKCDLLDVFNVILKALTP